MWSTWDIERTIKEWVMEAGIPDLRLVTYRYNHGVLDIYTTKPGYMIGLRGALINKYSEIFKKNVRNFKIVEMHEVVGLV